MIGSLCFWQATTLALDPALIRSAFAAHDVKRRDGSAPYVREPAGPHAALRRATARRRGAAVIASGLAWREVGVRASDGSLTFALAEQTKDADAGSYEEQGRVVVGAVDKPLASDHGKFWSNPPRSRLSKVDLAAVEDLRTAYEKERGVLGANELRALLSTILLEDLDGVRVKEPGSLYFVPEGRDLMPVKRALEDLHVRFDVFTVHDAQEASQLAPSAHRGLLDEVAELSAEVEALRARDGTRIETFAKRIEHLESVRKRAALYAALLSSSMAQVEEAADVADGAVRAAIAEVLSFSTQ